MSVNESIEDRRKRLLYRAKYRGFREADFLFGGFAEAHLDSLSDKELDEFEELLSLSDHDVYAWVTGKAPTPANLAGTVFDRLCAFDVSKLTAPKT